MPSSVSRTEIMRADSAGGGVSAVGGGTAFDNPAGAACAACCACTTGTAAPSAPMKMAKTSRAAAGLRALRGTWVFDERNSHCIFVFPKIGLRELIETFVYRRVRPKLRGQKVIKPMNCAKGFRGSEETECGAEAVARSVSDSSHEVCDGGGVDRVRRRSRRQIVSGGG